jgi:hypothetical protein
MVSKVCSGHCSVARSRFHREGMFVRSRVSLMERGKCGDIVRQPMFCVI